MINAAVLVVKAAIVLAVSAHPAGHTTVQPGDTLSGLYGSQWPAACQVNHLANCDLITAGQVLVNPGSHVTHGDGDGAAPGTAYGVAGHFWGDGDGDGFDLTHSPFPAAPVQSAPVQSSGVSVPSAPVQAAPVQTSGGSGQFHVPGMPQSFTNCIAFRESTNGTNPAANGNVFGIIPASGHNVSGMSVAQQEQVAGQIYATSGAAAWGPFDGC